jgi:hypothetical protein
MLGIRKNFIAQIACELLRVEFASKPSKSSQQTFLCLKYRLQAEF